MILGNDLIKPVTKTNQLPKSLQAINAGEGVEKREPSYIVSIATMENSVEIP